MTGQVRYRVIGMDCGSCAAKVENAARTAGARDLSISLSTQELQLEDVPEALLPRIEQSVAAAGYGLERLRGTGPAHLAPDYRRALWIVVILNLGYGVAEAIGGFIAGSQALKADALDFVGDGLITLLAVIATAWRPAWRARTALIQGGFLALMGLGVIGNTAVKVFTGAPIEAGIMGAMGMIALAVNVAAALVLMPHRKGDANLRAVWLFSRNDAIGNAAIVVAALAVAWTGQRWPDLITAFAIAGLFLHSAGIIIRHARQELRAAD
ncbi:MAG: cation transporter [Thalassovita sp.]|nr:cation transporter [Thalassovita sp.]